MLTTYISLAVQVAATVCAVLVISANPRRIANRALFLGIVHFAVWLFVRDVSNRYPEDIFWFRLCVSIGTLLLVTLVSLVEAISRDAWLPSNRSMRALGVIAAIAAVIPWTESFVNSSPTVAVESPGIGYLLHLAMISACYVAYFAISIKRVHEMGYPKRFELLAVTLPAGTIALTIFLLMGLRAVVPGLVPAYITPLLSLLFITILAYLIATHKIFDAQYLFRVTARFAIICTIITVAALIQYNLLGRLLPIWLILGFISAQALLVNHYLGRQLDKWFFSRPELSAARDTAHRIARTALSEDRLKADLAGTIGGWAEASVSIISPEYTVDPSAEQSSLSAQDPVYRALQGLGWATPERLQRERATEERSQVQAYLQAHRLGALIVATAEGTPLVLAVGQRISRRPFTYPEIQHLQEFAALSQLALTKVRLVEQAIHADRLATVGVLGASLAHEIRNPLYAIKAFAELLGDHYDRPEFRNRFRRMVTEELDRIDELLSQLMRMASPRKPVLVQQHLHGIIEQSLELVGHKARSHGIVVQTDFQATDDMIGTDAAYARQVLFNLCLNAIQVLVDRPDPRWIRLATRNIAAGLELTVSDNGPGIPEALRNRLFQRFQSMSARGLGLGLSISREIMLSLGGGLEVDAHRPGHGAVFRLVFPQERAAGTIAPPAHGQGVTGQQKV
jgi:signal transduction histidine kinase